MLVRAERSVKAYLDKTYLFALSVEVVNSLFDGVAYAEPIATMTFRSVGCAVVVEQLVVGADLGIDLVHVLLYDAGNSVVVGVAGLTSLEEDVGVLSGTAENGVLGVDRAVSESVERVPCQPSRQRQPCPRSQSSESRERF